jgi:hypothetical protein
MRPPLPSTTPDQLLTGFDPAGFVGEIAADGQRVRVAALATDAAGQVAFLSVVGYETSVSAALARLMKGEPLGVLPASTQSWDGPTPLQALRVASWLWRAEISGTREKQGVAIPRCASISQGLRTPPEIPPPAPRRPDESPPDPFAAVDALLARLRAGEPAPKPYPARIVLGAWHDQTPTAAAFVGHLRGLRVITLPSLAWVDYLWTTGLDYGLIAPLLSLGIRAGRLDGDPRPWNALVSDGVRRGLLPRTRPTAEDHIRLGLRRG